MALTLTRESYGATDFPAADVSSIGTCRLPEQHRASSVTRFNTVRARNDVVSPDTVPTLPAHAMRRRTLVYLIVFFTPSPRPDRPLIDWAAS